jgi:hypothetical protein
MKQEGGNSAAIFSLFTLSIIGGFTDSKRRELPDWQGSRIRYHYIDS